MPTLETRTLVVTIEAPFERVAEDLADPAAHPQWGTEFFAGAAEPQPDGSYRVTVPRLGGPARFKVDADLARGLIDLYLAPEGAAFGAPLPIRLLRNGSGVDVLWTLARPPHVPEPAWQEGLHSMERELKALKKRHETKPQP